MTLQIQEFEDLIPDNKTRDIGQFLDEILTIAKDLTVVNEPAFKKITEIYSESKIYENQIEFLRKQWNAPDQQRINARNDQAKKLLNPLKEIQSIAKSKSAGYHHMLEEANRREAESIREAVEMLGLEEVPYVPPMAKTIRSEGAVVYSKTIRKFRITDESKVPAKYLTVDHDAVARAIDMGVSEIPGIEVYEEKVIQMRTR